MNAGCWVRGAAFVLLLQPLGARADEPVVVDLEALNRHIGLEYENAVTHEELLQEALGRSLVLLGVVHDQDCPARQLQRLVLDLQERSSRPIRLGVEFVDRADADLLEAYLDSSLAEADFLGRVYPTSLLLSPQVGRAHLEILRFARQHRLAVVPLESRPSGARSRTLRNAEIRVHLAEQLGRRPEERLIVLYGVDHVFGADDIAAGLETAPLVVTSYADSVQERFRARHGRYPRPGEVLRLRPGVFLDPCEPPRRRRLLRLGTSEAREALLALLESVYFGNRQGLGPLVDALDDADVRWRRAVHHALRFASGEDLGYDPEADAGLRREVQVRWRAWWEAKSGAFTSAP